MQDVGKRKQDHTKIENRLLLFTVSTNIFTLLRLLNMQLKIDGRSFIYDVCVTSLTVRFLGVICFRISDPRSLRSRRTVTETDVSTLVMNSSVGSFDS